MSKNDLDPSNRPATSSGACVGATVRIRGEISGNEDLVVEGTVEGPIQLGDHKLTVGLDAKVNSEVVSREVVVHGSVKGNLRASDRIVITKNGSVVGDLITARILIEDGASFKGSIEIDRKLPAASSDKTVPGPATAMGPLHLGTTN